MAGKFKIVVSDLHMGAGFWAEGNALEDFDQDREFAALLDEIAAESERDGAEVELIFNGDAFEMYQVPHVERFDPTTTYLPKAVLGSDETSSARKMELIAAGHEAVFEALGRFLHAGPPRRQVTFVSGNHDLHLFWPAVQDRIRRVVGATSARAELLAFERRRISREGIYVEHGNQYAEILDRVKDMEQPLDPQHPGELALPVSARFVIDVLNQIEWERPWIDGVKPITALVWYALAFDPAFALRAIAFLLRALPGLLGEALPGVDEGSSQEMAAQLQDAGSAAKIGERYAADEAFRAHLNSQLADLLSPLPRLPGPVTARLVASGDPVAMGGQIRERVRTSFYLMARQRAAEAGAGVVIFGHTHDAHVDGLPGGAIYINSGTWTWWADLTGAGAATWRDLFAHPDRFADRRLRHYVRVDYDEEGRPSGQLLVYAPPVPVPAEGLVARLVGVWKRFVARLHGLWGRITEANL